MFVCMHTKCALGKKMDWMSLLMSILPAGQAVWKANIIPKAASGYWKCVSSVSSHFVFQNATKTVEEEKPRAPTIQELKQKIDNYNSKVNNCLLMKMVRIMFSGLHLSFSAVQ